MKQWIRTNRHLRQEEFLKAIRSKLSLSILASNVQDFSELEFVVTYDPSRMEVADLYDFTPQADVMAAGTIPGSNLEVTYQPGKIIFRKKMNIVPGTSWSGEVTTIVFRASVTDPESGFMKRIGKPEGFHFLEHRTVDHKFGIITDAYITPGNVNEPVVYIERLQRQINTFGLTDLEAVALDSGYLTPYVCKKTTE
ncbi:hypothetical protein E6C55_33455 [Cohnella fermenti]|uniref:Uncharacterized protein n=1 Tax=Cohnella fermenti TaxID=2565925 RepID=A0A4S4BE96_9BACL|nr:hypothetical protein E6C55_33455 [Cohnella fermenti]